MTVVRWFRVAFWANLVLLVCLVSVFFALHESNDRIRALLVEFRNSLITRSSSDPALLNLTPTDLTRHGFYTDSPAVVEAWRTRLLAAAPVTASDSRDEIDRVKAIVLSFSGGTGGRPIYRMPLLNKISETQRGQGFCSDYVEIFLALAEANGLTGREVQNAVHGFADFFSSTKGRWIFVDPLYGILATDEAGEYLSSVELRRRRILGVPVRFVFFNTNSSLKSEEDPRFQALYGDASLFKWYVLTYGNNVLTEASWSESLALFPWEARELLLYLSWTKPHMVVLADSLGDQGARELQRRYALVFFAVTGYFAIAIGCYPLLVFGTQPGAQVETKSSTPERARRSPAA